MKDPLGEALDRAKVLVDGVQDVETYKACNALYQVLDYIYLEMIGHMAPTGAKMVSMEDVMRQMARSKSAEEVVKTDPEEPSEAAKQRLEDIRKNSYL